jgi:hypothetical protein
LLVARRRRGGVAASQLSRRLEEQGSRRRSAFLSDGCWCLLSLSLRVCYWLRPFVDWKIARDNTMANSKAGTALRQQGSEQRSQQPRGRLIGQAIISQALFLLLRGCIAVRLLVLRGDHFGTRALHHRGNTRARAEQGMHRHGTPDYMTACMGPHLHHTHATGSHLPTAHEPSIRGKR